MKKSKKRQYASIFVFKGEHYRIEYSEDNTINLYRERDNELLRSTQLERDESALIYCSKWLEENLDHTKIIRNNEGEKIKEITI